MNSPSKLIVLTGGGTAGHVIPNLALVPLLQNAGWAIQYIGSELGIEKKLVSEKGLKFYGISTGKLRRYFDWKNFTDPFLVLAGIYQAWKILGQLKPKIVFSKGGFVAVPVVFAAWLRHIPILLHESDLTPGLANRLSIPFAKIICASFPQTLSHLPTGKGILTGAPIRAELFSGDKAKGLKFLNFDSEISPLEKMPDASLAKPLLLIVGGSMGSRNLNTAVRVALPQLLKHFRIAHLCGKGGLDSTLQGLEDYKQFEFVGPEMADILTAADLILSRSGSNAIFEFLALKKLNLLIPLSLKASRGDQILNANSFVSQGYSAMLPEEEIGGDRLLRELQNLQSHAEQYHQAMQSSPFQNGAGNVFEIIQKFA